MKTIKNFSLFVIFMAFVSLVIYACSAGQSDWEQDIENELELKTAMSRSAKMYTRVDSIAETDEFLDFKLAVNNLCNKALAYTSQFSDEELRILIENQNDDDYMEDFVEKAGLSKDLSLVTSTKERLLAMPAFSELNDEEKTLLIERNVEDNRILLKTMNEAGIAECDRRRMTDYQAAKAIAELELIGCTCTGNIPTACLCYVAVVANFANEIRKIDREYEDCIKNLNR